MQAAPPFQAESAQTDSSGNAIVGEANAIVQGVPTVISVTNGPFAPFLSNGDIRQISEPSSRMHGGHHAMLPNLAPFISGINGINNAGFQNGITRVNGGGMDFFGQFPMGQNDAANGNTIERSGKWDGIMGQPVQLGNVNRNTDRTITSNAITDDRHQGTSVVHGPSSPAFSGDMGRRALTPFSFEPPPIRPLPVTHVEGGRPVFLHGSSGPYANRERFEESGTRPEFEDIFSNIMDFTRMASKGHQLISNVWTSIFAVFAGLIVLLL